MFFYKNKFYKNPKLESKPKINNKLRILSASAQRLTQLLKNKRISPFVMHKYRKYNNQLNGYLIFL